jgi:transcriptional regulator with XRE-family HTH domain
MAALQIPAGSHDADVLVTAAADAWLELPGTTTRSAASLAAPLSPPPNSSKSQERDGPKGISSPRTAKGGTGGRAQTFGELLRITRQSQKLTLAVLARRCRIDAANLSRIERDERKPPAGPRLLILLDSLRLHPNSGQWLKLGRAAAAAYAPLFAQGITPVYVDDYSGPPLPKGAIDPLDRVVLIARLREVLEGYPIRTVWVETESGDKFEIHMKKRR